MRFEAHYTLTGGVKVREMFSISEDEVAALGGPGYRIDAGDLRELFMERMRDDFEDKFYPEAANIEDFVDWASSLDGFKEWERSLEDEEER